MSKYMTPGTPRKTVGAYLKVVKALNELAALGEDTDFHPWNPEITGLLGKITKDDGVWRFTQT